MVSKKDRINQEWNDGKSDQHSGLFNTHAGERRMLQTLLSDDEPIEAWIPGEYIDSEGNGAEKLDGVVVATDRRILFAKRIRGSWTGKTKADVMGYHAIEGVKQERDPGVWMAKTVLRISFSGGTSMEIKVPNSKRAIQDFVEVVEGHIYEPAASTVVQQASPMEELQKVAELHANGVLTDAEFQEVKADLLSKI